MGSIATCVVFLIVCGLLIEGIKCSYSSVILETYWPEIATPFWQTSWVSFPLVDLRTAYGRDRVFFWNTGDNPGQDLDIDLYIGCICISRYWPRINPNLASMQGQDYRKYQPVLYKVSVQTYVWIIASRSPAIISYGETFNFFFVGRYDFKILS